MKDGSKGTMMKHFPITPGPDEEPCPECHGNGFLYGDNGPAPREIDCDWCAGSGVVTAEEPSCDYCSGPLADGYCAACDEDVSLAPVVRVAPGKIAA
jgi:hypothetical protein